jgi:hypothetical protein
VPEDVQVAAKPKRRTDPRNRRSRGSSGRWRRQPAGPRLWSTPKNWPRSGCAVMIALVEERHTQLGVAPLCEALRLARATFYRRGPAARARPAHPQGAVACAERGGAGTGLSPAA